MRDEYEAKSVNNQPYNFILIAEGQPFCAIFSLRFGRNMVSEGCIAASEGEYGKKGARHVLPLQNAKTLLRVVDHLVNHAVQHLFDELAQVVGRG
jgi:hypothetical protein